MQQTFLRVRPLVPQAFIVASGLAMSAAGHAQTAYDKLNIGAQVSKGISFSAFAAPLPLPPGEWQVVSTAESKVSLMGGGSDAPGVRQGNQCGPKEYRCEQPHRPAGGDVHAGLGAHRLAQSCLQHVGNRCSVQE